MPAAVLLCEFLLFRRGRSTSRREAAALVVGAGLAMAAAAMLYLGTRPLDALASGYAIRDFGPLERLLTQSRVVWHYLGLFAFPHPERLSLLLDFPVSEGLLRPPSTLPAVLGLLGLAGLALWQRSRRPLIAFAIGWLFVHLAIESTVVGLQIAFEHRMYLPSVGLVLVIGYAASTVVAAWRWPVAVSAAVVVGALAAATWARNAVWADPERFWRGVVRVSPTDYRGYTNLGNVLQGRGEHREAARLYAEALRHERRDLRVYANLANALLALGQAEQALALLRTVVRNAPQYAAPRYNLAGVLLALERYDEATEQYREALAIEPRFVEARVGLASVYAATGRRERAIAELRRALAIRPDFAPAHAMLGELLPRSGERE